MEHNTKWLLLRDMDAFKPECHRLVLCQRDMAAEVLSGHCERRNEYVIDCFTGKSWGRLGTGKYLKWSTIPSAEMMASATQARPRMNKSVVVCVKIPQYFGVKIGRLHFDSDQLLWQIYSDASNSWVSIPASYIEGWLPLP